jgi:ABC-2 type transport system permease protein
VTSVAVTRPPLRNHFWRVFFIGGLISYRALFYWISPWQYIPTMLGAPLFQILFFVYLGRATGVGSTSFFVVGNSIQICSMAGIYGMTMAIANERSFQTLSPILATPSNRVALFLGRGLPVLITGLQTCLFGFLVSALILGFRPPLERFPVWRWRCWSRRPPAQGLGWRWAPSGFESGTSSWFPTSPTS